jgi:hypothetical protein
MRHVAESGSSLSLLAREQIVKTSFFFSDSFHETYILP